MADGDLALDADGDLLFAGGDLVGLTGAAAIASDCKSALQFFKGEWFLDLDVGVPWWQRILGVKNPNIDGIRAAFTDCLKARPGIISVDSMKLTFTKSTRTLSGEWRATSTLGQVSGSIQ